MQTNQLSNKMTTPAYTRSRTSPGRRFSVQKVAATRAPRLVRCDRHGPYQTTLISKLLQMAVARPGLDLEKN
jgi:hypothetical protein